MGYGSTDLSLEDILARDSSLRYDYAYECMQTMGFHEDRSQELATRSVNYAASNGCTMTDAVVTVLCDTITYVGGLVIGFLLILILLVAVANVVNLSFRLPNLELLDEIGGAFLGFVKGLLYCVLLCWLLSFFGLILGKETLGGTVLGNFFLQFRFITRTLI